MLHEAAMRLVRPLLIARGPAWGLENAHPPRPSADRLGVEIAISHLVGGRLTLKAAMAGQLLEFEVPGNLGAGGGRAQAPSRKAGWHTAR